MKYRISWVKCSDCGRHGVNGGCYIVENKFLWWWNDYITTYSAGGTSQAEHYSTFKAANDAFNMTQQPKPSEYVVMKEWSE